MKRRAAKESKSAADASLIAACVEYAQVRAASKAGYDVDPSFDADHAAASGDQFMRRARNALALAAKIRPQSAAGLDAEARIVPIVVDVAECPLDEGAGEFLRKFALDVRRILDPIKADDRVAERLSTAKPS
jgi:hypothetical protein